jgi:hypothetical protein
LSGLIMVLSRPHLSAAQLEYVGCQLLTLESGCRSLAINVWVV